MDQRAIDSSSEPLQKLVNYISEHYSSDVYSGFNTPPVAYFLDKFGSEKAIEFLSNWPSDDVHRGPIVFEGAPQATLYAKLVAKHRDLQADSTFVDLKSRIESAQTKHGGLTIADTDIGPLWILVQQEDVDDNVIREGIEFFLSEVVPDKDRLRTRRLALGILVLSKYDYFRYSDEINKLSEELYERAKQELGEPGEGPIWRFRGTKPWLILLALNRSEVSYEDFMQDLVDDIIQGQNEDGSFFDQDSLMFNATVGLTLIAAGQGPKIPKQDLAWERDLHRQEIEAKRPDFVRTVPIDPSASYAAEIQDSAEGIISEVSDILRVNSLYIDMLFDDIIDQIKTTPELEVRVLTRGRNVKGNRKRIKKDVLNDLIEATEGGVREHHRVHSRLVIGDQDEVVVSSADLTRDQLRDQFNAGFYTRDPDSVQEAIDYFDQVWEEAENVQIG
ncbi:phospholipase D-like domain-containing protein [Natronoarchaeum mannanilyticum]